MGPGTAQGNLVVGWFSRLEIMDVFPHPAPAFPVTLLHLGTWRDDLNDAGAQMPQKTGKTRVQAPALPISKAYMQALAEKVWKNA